MVTTEFNVKPNITSLHYDNGVMIPEHSDSTVEIKLEYVTDAEVAALFKVYAIKEANVNGKKED